LIRFRQRCCFWLRKRRLRFAELDITGLQLLTPAQVERVTGLPVTIMTNKKNSLGLQWAEIGQVFRLPGYSSPQQFLATALPRRCV